MVQPITDLFEEFRTKITALEHRVDQQDKYLMSRDEKITAMKKEIADQVETQIFALSYRMESDMPNCRDEVNILFHQTKAHFKETDLRYKVTKMMLDEVNRRAIANQEIQEVVDEIHHMGHHTYDFAEMSAVVRDEHLKSVTEVYEEACARLNVMEDLIEFTRRRTSHLDDTLRKELADVWRVAQIREAERSSESAMRSTIEAETGVEVDLAAEAEAETETETE